MITTQRKKELFFSLVALFSLLVPIFGIGYVYGVNSPILVNDLGDAPTEEVYTTNYDNIVLSGSNLSGNYASIIFVDEGITMQILSNVDNVFWNDKIPTKWSVWIKPDKEINLKLLISGLNIGDLTSTKRYLTDINIGPSNVGLDTFVNYTFTDADKIFLQSWDTTGLFMETNNPDMITKGWLDGVDGFSLDWVVSYQIDESQSLLAGSILIITGTYYVVLGLFMTPWIDVNVVRKVGNKVRGIRR